LYLLIFLAIKAAFYLDHSSILSFRLAYLASLFSLYRGTRLEQVRLLGVVVLGVTPAYKEGLKSLGIGRISALKVLKGCLIYINEYSLFGRLNVCFFIPANLGISVYAKGINYLLLKYRTISRAAKEL
jgi:hypothetical protein